MITKENPASIWVNKKNDEFTTKKNIYDRYSAILTVFGFGNSIINPLLYISKASNPVSIICLLISNGSIFKFE